MTLTDRSTGGDQRNNYMKKLLMMYEAGQIPPGSFSEMTISHDDDCAVFDGGFCGCNPGISLGVIPG